MNRRIVEKKVNLDYESVKNFFEQRGKNKDLPHRYNYVLYQDDCPELAVRRDRQEKEKISALLSWRKGQRILDIGCGIGRWGEYLLQNEMYYVGMDASEKMIAMAEENLGAFSHKKLLVGTFQEFREKLNEADEMQQFDKVFVNGVFMYLNDGDYGKALEDIREVCADSCELYVKESMGIEKRLTLEEIYSESLSQNYSAIYRSIEEYRQSLTDAFGKDFTLVAQGRLFDEDLENRVETTDYFYIFRK